MHPFFFFCKFENSLVLSGVGLGDLLDHEHPGVAVVLDLVPAAVLDRLPVEGPRDLRLGVAPHVADEADIAVQDLRWVDIHGGRFDIKESKAGPTREYIRNLRVSVASCSRNIIDILYYCLLLSQHLPH